MDEPLRWRHLLLGILCLMGCDQGHGELIVSQIVVPDCLDEATDFTIPLDILAVSFEGDTLLYRLHEGSGGLHDSNGLTIRILDTEAVQGGVVPVGAQGGGALQCCSKECGPCQGTEICVPGDATQPWVCVPNVQAYLELFRTCQEGRAVFALYGSIEFNALGMEEGKRIRATSMDLEIVPQGGGRSASGVITGFFDFEFRIGLPYQPFSEE